MSAAGVLAFASAGLACTLAMIVAWQERRSIAHWTFVVGMLVLAAESVFSGLAEGAALPERMAYWQNARFVAMAFLPGIWLFFSLSYARGNYREFLTRWRFLLVAGFLVPLGLAGWFPRQLVVAVPSGGPGSTWMLDMGLPGAV